MSKLKLGQILLQRKYATPEDLIKAKEIQQNNPNMTLAEVFLSMNITSEANILSALAERMGLDFKEVLYIDNKDVFKLVPEKTAKKYHIIPAAIDDNNRLILAMNDPTNIEALEEIKMIANMEIRPLIATKKAIEDAIDKYYSSSSAQKMAEGIDSLAFEIAQSEAIKDIESRVDSAPIVKLLNNIIQYAYQRKASDIHIEPFKDCVKIRMRIDGDLQEYLTITPSALKNLITRIKILANMNIAEKRIPLDGRFEYNHNNLFVDIRVSTLPTTYGEKAVLRLLGTALGKNVSLADLGMTPANVEKFTRIIKAPNGIILITGPTGSGKTTTLYTALQEVNRPEVNITTIEDPVEKKVAGINQVQTNDKAGMDFATGLRAILRQDPDIIMIGEIRDTETADITIRAAITGHLVLSTLHTNDSVASIARLIDMGVEPYMVAAAVNGIMAQRLCKVLCPKCKEKTELSDFHRKLLNDKNLKEAYKAVGCPNCSYTGYSGRTSVHEVLEFNPIIREMISKNKSIDDIKAYARSTGMEFLADNIVSKIRKGITSVDEFMRLIYTII